MDENKVKQRNIGVRLKLNGKSKPRLRHQRSTASPWRITNFKELLLVMKKKSNQVLKNQVFFIPDLFIGELYHQLNAVYSSNGLNQAMQGFI